ncbi:MAG: terpene cyclase/mutase family protein [Gemmataceae bacterium]|nr:terpene cyclase/mutase family protein [Gemmataceae bacterium]
MRPLSPLVLVLVLLLPLPASAQNQDIQDAIDAKLGAIRFVRSLEDPAGGFRRTPADKAPGLRATSGGVRSLGFLGQPVPNKEKHAAFVLKCYDPATGGFAEPGAKPDVPLTAIGVIAAAELGVPKEKYAKALDYLKANAKTFEEMRVGCAAVEAWGPKDSPIDVTAWLAAADDHRAAAAKNPDDGLAREVASAAAMPLRVGVPRRQLAGAAKLDDILQAGQRPDGGWGKAGAKESDFDTTYRVMRALYLMKERPKDRAKLRAYVARHRNPDGGYSAAPGEGSSLSGVYYAAIITKWLDELEK